MPTSYEKVSLKMSKNNDDDNYNYDVSDILKISRRKSLIKK